MEANRKDSRIGIEILYSSPDLLSLAMAVGYGVEEEGLPYYLKEGAASPSEARALAHRAGLGVVITIDREKISVFCRQLKEDRPLFSYPNRGVEDAKTIGKNGARIFKSKPFIDMKPEVCKCQKILAF